MDIEKQLKIIRRKTDKCLINSIVDTYKLLHTEDFVNSEYVVIGREYMELLQYELLRRFAKYVQANKSNK